MSDIIFILTNIYHILNIWHKKLAGNNQKHSDIFGNRIKSKWGTRLGWGFYTTAPSNSLVNSATNSRAFSSTFLAPFRAPYEFCLEMTNYLKFTRNQCNRKRDTWWHGHMIIYIIDPLKYISINNTSTRNKIWSIINWSDLRP